MSLHRTMEQILAVVQATQKQERHIMADLTALQAAVDKVAAAVAVAVQDIATLKAEITGSTEAEQPLVDAMTQKLTDADAALEAATAPPA